MILALALALAIGVALGMLGGGGAILVVPVLVYVLDQTPQEAATASLFIVTFAAMAGGVGQARHGNVCWNHAAFFTLAALPAIAIGTALGDAVSGEVLLGAFGGVMLVAAVAISRKRDIRGEASDVDGCPRLRRGWDAAFGALVGLLTGFLGIGGGFVVIPVLVLALGFPMRAAIGTSLAIITATGVLGAAVHLVAGRSIDLDVVAALTAVMVAGAVAGATLSQRVPEIHLSRAFSLLVGAVGLYLIVSSTLLGGPPVS